MLEDSQNRQIATHEGRVDRLQLWATMIDRLKLMVAKTTAHEIDRLKLLEQTELDRL